MLRELLEYIMNYGELTKTPNIYGSRNTILSKPHYYIKFFTREIDEDIALVLIQSNIVELDSGNWETGEQHYIIDYDRMYYNNKLGKINFILKNIKPYLNKSELIINELNQMKLMEERKRKISIINGKV